MLFLIARHGHDDEQISAEPKETLGQLFDRIAGQVCLNKMGFELIPKPDHVSGDSEAPCVSLHGSTDPYCFCKVQTSAVVAGGNSH